MNHIIKVNLHIHLSTLLIQPSIILFIDLFVSAVESTLQKPWQPSATHILLKSLWDLGLRRQKPWTFDSVKRQPDSEPNTCVLLGWLDTSGKCDVPLMQHHAFDPAEVDSINATKAVETGGERERKKNPENERESHPSPPPSSPVIFLWCWLNESLSKAAIAMCCIMYTATMRKKENTWGKVSVGKENSWCLYSSTRTILFLVWPPFVLHTFFIPLLKLCSITFQSRVHLFLHLN